MIYRLPNDESIIFPRSHCPNCETKLGVIDLIPIISFVFNKGRCRYCRTKISWQYPLVELLTGIFLTILFIQYQFSVNFWIYAFLTILLMTCTFIDYKHKIIPNKITYPGILIGLILSILFNHITLQSALLGILIPGGFLLLVAIITKGGMGIGDVKFAAMIGTYIGAEYTLIGIFIGSLVGSVLGLGLIGLGLKDRKSRIPFGPLIALGNTLMLFWGEEVVGWYLQI
ncbi:leader peptidase (prepilin peptidase) / N-methyltransferase [Candidatus Frackibacter sp. WG12]|nr:leader peptidase (prepilin peptidase) / N-methyltransferase [Candidatus Frackibacter sp. WG11]SEM68842.1 leader peptidase (prepilin peptidase) / N-methyltransferase [Candidatus Frackibacter sp. WG12]SFL80146.1 leader peptidase (prepilin peptidase) / N-methyltransferase [Candidatus Frackibacter sp. WG13]